MERLYSDLLGRGPDAAGEAGWLQALANGESRNAVAYGFATSTERESLVVAADYRQCLGRTPGSAEVAFWVNALAEGMTEEAVAAGIASSPEAFFIDAGSDLDTWIRSVYQAILQRSADDNEVQVWLGVLSEQEWQRL